MEDYDDYPYYSGEQDPRLYEPKDQDDVDSYDHVECSDGCGFWAGQLIDEGQCPECGSECRAIADDYFDD